MPVTKKYSALICLTLFLVSARAQLHDTLKSDTTSQLDQERTLFLTGAAGFIGSNFLQYMFKKYPTYRFIVLDALTYAGNLENISDTIKTSERFTFVHDTITNENVIDQCMQQCDFVVHFAAETDVTRSIYDARAFVDTNVIGTETILKSLTKHKSVQRFIHISTSEVYGTAETEPMTEEHPLNPRSPYAATKAGADRLVYAYCCTYDIPAVIIRPFNNYGPNQHTEKVIPRFITRALKGKNLTIHGNGDAKRDWVHVLDTCVALDRVLHLENFDTIKHEVINIGTGTSISVQDIANLIKKQLRLPDNSITYQNDRPGQVLSHISSTEKAYRLLGWKAQHSLTNSLRTIIEWNKTHEQWWNSLQDMHDLTPLALSNGTTTTHTTHIR